MKACHGNPKVCTRKSARNFETLKLLAWRAGTNATALSATASKSAMPQERIKRGGDIRNAIKLSARVNVQTKAAPAADGNPARMESDRLSASMPVQRSDGDLPRRTTLRQASGIQA